MYNASCQKIDNHLLDIHLQLLWWRDLDNNIYLYFLVLKCVVMYVFLYFCPYNIFFVYLCRIIKAIICKMHRF